MAIAKRALKLRMAEKQKAFYWQRRGCTSPGDNVGTFRFLIAYTSLDSGCILMSVSI